MAFTNKSIIGQYEGPSSQQRLGNSVLYQREDLISIPIQFEEDPVSLVVSFEEDPVSIPVHFEEDPISIPVHFEEDPVAIPVFFEEDPVSVAIHFEEDLVSLPVYFEEDPVAIPLHFGERRSIPLLNFKALGHNANFSKEFIKMHEVKAFDTTNSNDSLFLLRQLTLQKQSDLIDNKSIASIVWNGTYTPYLMEYFSVNLYAWASTFNAMSPTVNRFYTDLDLRTAYNVPSNVFFPNVPVFFGAKQAVDETQETDKPITFASNPVIIPVIKSLDSNYFLLTTGVGSHNALVYSPYTSAQYVSIWTNSEVERDDIYNKSLVGKYLYIKGLHHAPILVTSATRVFEDGHYKLWLNLDGVSPITEDISDYTDRIYYSDLSISSGWVQDIGVSPDIKSINGKLYDFKLAATLTPKGLITIREPFYFNGHSVGGTDLPSETAKAVVQYLKIEDAPYYSSIESFPQFGEFIQYDPVTYPRSCMLLCYRVRYDGSYRYFNLLTTPNVQTQISFDHLDYCSGIVGIGIYYIPDWDDIPAMANLTLMINMIKGGASIATAGFSGFWYANGALQTSSNMAFGNASASAGYDPTSSSYTDKIKRIELDVSWMRVTSWEDVDYDISYEDTFDTTVGMYCDPYGSSATGYILYNGARYATEGLVFLQLTPPVDVIELRFRLYSRNGFKDDGQDGTWSNVLISRGNVYGTNTSIRANQYTILEVDKSSAGFTGKIFDPAILSDRLCTYFLCNLLNRPSNTYTNIATTTANAQDQLETTTELTSTIRSIAGVICDKSDSEGKFYLLPSNTIIDTKNIQIIYDVNDTFALTLVALTTHSRTLTTTTTTNGATVSLYYFGIINKTTLRHFTPVNLIDGQTGISFGSIPIVSNIDIIKNTLTDIKLNLKIGSLSYYISFQEISNIQGSFYIPETMQDDYVLIVRSSTIQTTALYDETYQTESVDETGILSAISQSQIKTAQLILHDELFVHKITNHFQLELTSGAINSFLSDNLPNQSALVIRDNTDYIGYSVVIPTLFPCYGYSLTSCDILGYGVDLSTAWATFATAVGKMMWYIEQIMNTDHTKHKNLIQPNRCYGSMIIVMPPSIDIDSHTYSMLPEKATEYFSLDNMNLLKENGQKYIVINNKQYVQFNNNLYASSRIGLVKKNSAPLFNIYGDIYTLGNIITVAADNATYVYSISENMGTALMRVIAGRLITAPAFIGQEILFVCHNGLHTLKSGIIRKYDSNITRASIKTLSTGQFAIFLFIDNTSVDVQSDPVIYNPGTGLLYQPYIQDTEVPPVQHEPYIVPDRTVIVFLLDHELNIIEPDIGDVSLADLNTINVINDNVLSNKMQLTNIDSGTNTYLMNSVYELEFTGVIGQTNSYFKTEPIYIPNPEKPDDIFMAKTIKISYRGSCDLTINTYNCANALSNTRTFILSSADTIKLCNIIGLLCNGSQIECVIENASTDFQLLQLHIVGEFVSNKYITD